MKTDFIAAINQVSSEKGVSKEVVIEAIEAALVSAYKRNFGAAANQDVVVRINRQSGDVQVYVVKHVAEEASDARAEISLAEARQIDPDAQVGGIVEVETTPQNFGRIAAQTAKQVVLQRLREAERELVYEAFTEREADVVTGVIQRLEPKAIIIDLGKAEAAMPITEQVPGETYRPGQRLKVYLVEVSRTPRGPQIIVSRAHRGLVRRLFELEVPEVFSGAVEIKAIAREPGSRSKVAVAARQEGVDPVGSCVGVRGVRIQNIVNELHGEKIDVVQWHADPTVFVANALSPAPVISVDLHENDKTANVVVPEKQLSLAIGREGQNARLAAKLTGWRIDIKSTTLPRLEGVTPQFTREESLARLTGSLEERPD
ncbi:MAG TPA: transcription termination factor NusA [Chloroflexota bacterium]|nr:transcription termination factor NusA [Chloroflexota bacterium]